MRHHATFTLTALAAVALAAACAAPPDDAREGAEAPATTGAAGTTATRSAPASAERGIDPGERPPDLTLPTLGGDDFTLSAQAGRRPVVIVAFRGSW